jgi:NAD(P)-dependent dehydrogenase (short-subunit alcohol dehydrogenase family)
MKTAVITGVSSGIGRATAELLERNRFRTFGTVRSDSAPIPKVKLLRIDVRGPEAARAGVAAVLDRAGRIEFLVNNACVSLVGAAEETSIDEARDLFETNFYLSSWPFLTASSALCSISLRSETISYLILASALGRLRAPEMSSPDRQIWPYLFVIALFLHRTHVQLR